MEAAEAPVLIFGDFSLDVRRRRLVHRVTGCPSQLTGRPLDALIYLASRPGDLVAKEELMAAVWSGLTVEENSVAKCISAIRAALGEQPKDKCFIATEPRRGYRFIAEVKAADPVDPAPPSRRLSTNPQASQLFVSGWSALTRPGAATLQRGLEQLEQAVQVDPHFALAHACVAGAYALLGVFGLAPPKDVFPKAESAALAAIAADANLADGHAQLGHVHTMFTFDFVAADACFRRALALNPDCLVAHHYLALQAICAGKFDAAIQALRRAQAIEPLAPNISANIAMAHYYAGDYAQAIAQAEATLDIAPQFAHAESILGRSWLRLGHVDRALALFQRRTAETIGSAADVPAALALAGRQAEARRRLDELKTVRRERYVSAFDIATIHAALNDSSDALEWLETAFIERAQPVSALAIDPAFHHLGGEPRLRNILDKLGRSPSAGLD